MELSETRSSLLPYRMSYCGKTTTGTWQQCRTRNTELSRTTMGKQVKEKNSQVLQ